MPHWTDFLDPQGPGGALLPWKKVEARVGISRTTAWRLQKAGDFPKPYVVSPGRVAYRESEVEAWKISRGHRSVGAATVRQARTSAEGPARSAPVEAPSWSPPVRPAMEEALSLESAPSSKPVATRPRRQPARDRRRGPAGDQMTFEF